MLFAPLLRPGVEGTATVILAHEEADSHQTGPGKTYLRCR
jgi:hypothetical protein